MAAALRSRMPALCLATVQVGGDDQQYESDRQKHYPKRTTELIAPLLRVCVFVVIQPLAELVAYILRVNSMFLELPES